MQIDTVIVPNKDVVLPRRFAFLVFIGAFTAYIMVIPALIAHISAWIFEQIYFRILEIPLVQMKDHIVLDRWNMQHLNLFQRFNCFYCDYINGLASWLKAVVNRAELYSCAIKHGTPYNGQEHQKGYARTLEPRQK